MTSNWRAEKKSKKSDSFLVDLIAGAPNKGSNLQEIDVATSYVSTDSFYIFKVIQRRISSLNSTVLLVNKPKFVPTRTTL
jgi:hypothetical protein